MRNFELSKNMLTMGGQFYPTGHIVAMFADEKAARNAGRTLSDGGVADEEICLITPEVMLRDIVRTVGSADSTLPSPGTEADTVRRYADYASKGHYALLIHAPHGEDAERVMALLKDQMPAFAERYRMLVIEDLA
ncbi:hypothetical protein [Ramlibacter sp. Leaf400]|uniref:hypothetical protein n=1 Tax=Ramlibacter sp. Leaf400 TaxID=1736365 RepID=UPI0006F53576|nr:hypothetical protein [Ramlibacter sp. Leaf400]KQT10162.1 hypothetical protein ASG30_09890 [Ramlibacter sp. Leaf400]